MDLSIPLTADALFEAAGRQSEQMGALANQSLSNGIEKYIRKDFKGAVLDFKRAFGLAPYSDHAVDAVKYLALSHQGLEQNDKAIQATGRGLTYTQTGMTCSLQWEIFFSPKDASRKLS